MDEDVASEAEAIVFEPLEKGNICPAVVSDAVLGHYHYENYGFADMTSCGASYSMGEVAVRIKESRIGKGRVGKGGINIYF